MSYDLIVFDVDAAPENKNHVIPWLCALDENDDDHNHSADPTISSPALQKWLTAMAQIFPPLDGPLANDDLSDSPYCTDYSFSPDTISASFAWSKATTACQLAILTAKACNVGIFDISGADHALFPDDIDKDNIDITGAINAHEAFRNALDQIKGLTRKELSEALKGHASDIKFHIVKMKDQIGNK